MPQRKGAVGNQRVSDTHTPCKHWGKLTQPTTKPHWLTLKEKVRKNSTKRDIRFPPMSRNSWAIPEKKLGEKHDSQSSQSFLVYAMAYPLWTQSCVATVGSGRMGEPYDEVHLGGFVHILYKWVWESFAFAPLYHTLRQMSSTLFAFICILSLDFPCRTCHNRYVRWKMREETWNKYIKKHFLTRI